MKEKCVRRYLNKVKNSIFRFYEHGKIFFPLIFQFIIHILNQERKELKSNISEL